MGVATGKARENQVTNPLRNGLHRVDGPLLLMALEYISNCHASTAPEVCNSRDSTSTQATAMAAGWPKPAKAASLGTRPAITDANRVATATTSCRHLPQANNTTVATRMAQSSVCSLVIPLP